MPERFNNRQKSLKRRFLLILGVTLFVAILSFGLMILFRKDILPQLDGYRRTGFGVLIILYAILRFVRVFKKDVDEV